MKQNKSMYILALTGLFIALSYIGTMFNIPFSLGGAKTMIHFGNIFCLLGALILGGRRGGLAASIGMGTFDVLNGWAPYAPSTIILKFMIALIAGTVFMRLRKAEKPLVRSVVLSCLAGMAFNMVFSPIASYLTNQFIIGTNPDIAMVVAGWQSITVLVNAVIAVSIASTLYMALRPIIERNANLDA